MEATIRKEELYFMSETGKRIYTIEDIEALPEGQRAELLDGEMYMLACPTTTHQLLLIWLNSEIFRKIREKGGLCKAIPAPFAVYLKNDNINYVEPDITVLCDMDKLDQKGCHGAPDWIIEIISPSSKKLDYYLKLNAYQDAGVREYWVIDPEKKAIVVYDLDNDEPPFVYHFEDKVPVGIFEDVVIDFSQMKDYYYEP